MSIVPAASESIEDLQENHWAFISYVTEDLPWCDWLYFTLHGYPVPVALSVRATRYGFPLPENLSAFPDPNDPEHLNHLHAALGDARFLIVVVSPHSAHSPQIDEHIREFKRTAGEERIIALVVEGMPVSSSSLCVRSENRDWLPRWLQWRLADDGHFKPAGPTEPLIIDARPGYANLDDVMTSLIAVLLDVPREELELLEALTPEAGDNSQLPARFLAADRAAAALADSDNESAPQPAESRIDNRRKPSAKGGAMLVSVVLALLVAVIFLERESVTPKPAVSVTDSKMNSAGEQTPVVPPVTEAQAEPQKVESEKATATAIPEVPEVQNPPANAELIAGVAPVAEMPGAEPASAVPLEKAVENTPPPADTKPPRTETDGEREIAIRLEKEALLVRADEMMRRGAMHEAMAVYESALEAVQRFAELPESQPAAKLEVARVCRTLGALQLRFASSSEAKQTYERGRKAIQKLKLPKGEAKERTALLSDLEAGLRRIDRDLD